MSENDSMSAETTGSTDETVVILGNGFDLECSLPTKYSDFIRFVTCLEERWLETGNERANDLHPALKEALEMHNPRKGWKRFFNNFWYRHFKKFEEDLGWIDFEKELARVVRSVEDSMVNSPHAGVSDINDEIIFERHSLLETLINESYYRYYKISSFFTIWIRRCAYAMYFMLGIFLIIFVLNPIINILKIDSEVYFAGILFLSAAIIILLIVPALIFSCFDYSKLKRRSVAVTFPAILQSYFKAANPLSHGVFKYKTLTKRTVKRSGARYNTYSLKYSEFSEYLLKEFNTFIRAFEL